VQWTLVKKLWRFKEAWVFCFGAGEFMTLPVNNMSKSSKDFMLSKLQQVGAKII
jgi:hypothetical protein